MQKEGWGKGVVGIVACWIWGAYCTSMGRSHGTWNHEPQREMGWGKQFQTQHPSGSKCTDFPLGMVADQNLRIFRLLGVVMSLHKNLLNCFVLTFRRWLCGAEINPICICPSCTSDTQSCGYLACPHCFWTVQILTFMVFHNVILTSFLSHSSQLIVYVSINHRAFLAVPGMPHILDIFDSSSFWTLHFMSSKEISDATSVNISLTIKTFAIC